MYLPLYVLPDTKQQIYEIKKALGFAHLDDVVRLLLETAKRSKEMIICESEFRTPDPDDPTIALTEVDYYAWIPPTGGIPNHRLSLRKRLTTGNYEVYRKYVNTTITTGDIAGMPIAYIQHKVGEDAGEKVIISTPDLQAAIDCAKAEVKRFHGYESQDKVCAHQYPTLAFGCKKREEN